ncbi:MAG: hypothetical protein LUB60_05775, partial [Clostridiales bacterium]|nr:hypothetical protein [Clostridiales bacterium]
VVLDRIEWQSRETDCENNTFYKKEDNMKAKKIVSLVLAGAMVFSLAACGSTSTSTTTDTAEETETSVAEETEAAETEEADATEATGDFTWNEQYEVWAILPTTGVPGLLVHADSMGYVMEKYGFTYVTKDASTSSEVQLIEDAIAAGNVGCLMIATSDQAAIEDACNEATEAGIAERSRMDIRLRVISRRLTPLPVWLRFRRLRTG